MKQQSITILLIILMSIFGAKASAHDIEVANADGVVIYYNWINDNTELAVSYCGSSVSSYSNEYSGNVVLPESVEYNGSSYNVTSIGNSAFSACSSLTSVTIPNSVTSIGNYVFSNCSGLTSITIPNSVISIGEFAFSNCSGLTSVIIGDGVTSIGSNAFENCTSLTSVTIPKSVTSIGSGAFYNCSSLSSVTIPNGVTSIEDYTFANCSGLTSMTIPNSVTNIGKEAFSFCSGLTSLIIGDGVTSIGNGAFNKCSGLTSVMIVVTDLSAFCNNKIIGLVNNYIKKPVVLIDNAGMEITEYIIPNDVTSIGQEAFHYCSGLISVTIGNNVTSIGSKAFQNCRGLTSVTIPNSVTFIGGEAFQSCISLTSVTIPNSVTSIGSEAFYGCSGLTSVTIPNSVTSIGGYAFQSCKGLEKVYIGNSIKNINNGAFSYCDKLQDFYCYAYHYPQTGNDVFKGSYIDYVTLHVPMDAVEQYKALEPWKNFKSVVGLEGSMGETPKCATPVIVHENGKLYFTCETPGVEYVTDFVSNDNKNNSIIDLNGTYTFRVYAKKFGYDNSDFATKVINLSEGGTSSGKIGEVNGDGVVDAADVVKVTNIIMGAE